MPTPPHTEQPQQPAAPPMPAAEGRRVPDVPLRVLRPQDDQGEGAGQWQSMRADAFFGGRTVLLFALPGAFTPTCSSQHLPRYEELAHALRAAGVDEIACLAVNDPFVMQAWAQDEDVHEVTLLADGNCEFTEALGMAVDKRDLGFGRRSWRYSMLVRDGTIEKLFAERDEGGDPYRVSDPALRARPQAAGRRQSRLRRGAAGARDPRHRGRCHHRPRHGAAGVHQRRARRRCRRPGAPPVRPRRRSGAAHRVVAARPARRVPRAPRERSPPTSSPPPARHPPPTSSPPPARHRCGCGPARPRPAPHRAPRRSARLRPSRSRSAGSAPPAG